jgi:hypothetical protein
MFFGFPHLQRKDDGFGTYAQFDAWTSEDRNHAKLLNNLNPKFWKHLHLLNLAHTKWAKYGDNLDNNPNSKDEMRRLNRTKVEEFNTHHSWLLIMKGFQEFTTAGGHLS